MALAARLSSCGRPLDSSPRRLGELRRSDDAAGDFEELRRRAAEDGYLFIPGFLDRDDVVQARISVIEVLNAEGVFDPAFPVEDAVARPGLDMAFRPDLANGNPVVASLLYSDRMMGLFSGLLGGEAMHYDYTWLRAVAPGKATPPHYDVVYMGRGTKSIYTAWVPMSDIPYEVGGLMILENSHRLEELKATYGQMDVDVACSNKPGVSAINAHGYPGFGVLSEDPVEVAEQLDLRWLTAEFRMGDLLTFTMFTLHASTDNQSNLVRLSTDSRYQLASEPADERWVGANPIGHGPNARREMIC